MKDSLSTPVLELSNVTKSFMVGPEKLVVLNAADLSIQPGETVALVAPSGTGKTTLLQIAAMLDTPNEGIIRIDGDILPINDKRRSAIRCQKVGFVYQFHHLLNDFSVLENVMLPSLCAGIKKQDAKERATELLKSVGLASKLECSPGEISGGERQRTAIARAVMNSPSILLADEPTGNLDLKTGNVVFDLLIDLVKTHKTGALIATHNLELAKKMDRVITLKEGKITSYK